MSQEELVDVTHKIVMQHFAFAHSLAHALNGGHNQKEMGKFIIKESIKELEYLLKKNDLLFFYCNILVGKNMSEAQFFWPIGQRRFVLLQYRVDSNAFVIIVSYDKHMFEHKINEFVRDLIKEAPK